MIGLTFFSLGFLLCISVTQPTTREPTSRPVSNGGNNNLIKIYRYWKGSVTDHFYTGNGNEIGTTTIGQVGNHGYKSEGIGFQLKSSNSDADAFLYRYWKSQGSDHFYTTNANEIGTIIPGKTGKYGYVSEGYIGKCYKTKKYGYLVPLYRYWKASGVDHFYTTNANEIGTTTIEQVGNHGYKSEGIACYVIPSNFGSNAENIENNIDGGEAAAMVKTVDWDFNNNNKLNENISNKWLLTGLASGVIITLLIITLLGSLIYCIFYKKPNEYKKIAYIASSDDDHDDLQMSDDDLIKMS